MFKPYCDWNRISTDSKFEVTVKTDSNDAKCSDKRRSMTRSVVYLNGVPEIFSSSTQKMVSLSNTKAELNAAVMGVQDALLVKNILKSLGLKVKLILLHSIENGKAIDIGKEHTTWK